MAKKGAASGLKLSHLKTAAQKSSSGIRDLFMEYAANNKPRVTHVKKICDRVQDYLAQQNKTGDKDN